MKLDFQKRFLDDEDNYELESRLSVLSEKKSKRTDATREAERLKKSFDGFKPGARARSRLPPDGSQ